MRSVRNLLCGAAVLGCVCATAGAGTGFYSVAERNGRWVALDPEGRPFTFLGVDHVRPDGHMCEALGYAPYGRFVETNYPSREAWAVETVDRLKSWGFNALGSGCEFRELQNKGLVRTVFLSMGESVCYGDKSLWISKCLYAPGTAFPNVFHPGFAEACERIAAEKCAGAKDDRSVFGYFIDNELAWLGDGMFDAVMARSDDDCAKKSLVAWRGDRPVTPELKKEFLGLCAERYFAITTSAIRRHDPNHLVLGCRFAGIAQQDPVWKAAARHCDVLTFNHYPWADLDRNVVLTKKGGVRVKEVYDDLYARAKRPLLITEWSFPAIDTDVPSRYGEGQRFETQALRVQATELFAKTLLSLPYFIGYDYFMWVDEPPLGIGRHFPEDSNYGLVNNAGKPYGKLTQMFAALHRDVAKWRKAGVPPERTAPTDAKPVFERDRFLSAVTGSPEAVRFERTANGWRLSNDVGLVLSGGTGGDLVADVARGTRHFGTCGALLDAIGAKGHQWIDAREAQTVSFSREGVCGALTVRAEGGDGSGRFALTVRFTVAPGRGDFLCELVSVENVGTTPWNVQGLYFRPFAAGRPKEAIPSVPFLWKGRLESGWRFDDGSAYTLVSGDPDVIEFRAWIDGGGVQHPDMRFVPPEPLVLKPGETYRPPRPFSALARPVCGEMFFGVDSAAAWLARPGFFKTPTGEEDLFRYTVGKIAETGFRQARERLSWREVNPRRDEWKPEHYLKVYSLYREKGIRVSGMFHDAPDWTAPKGKLPTDLQAVYAFAKRLGETFGDLVDDWEFWNEEDIGFCEASAWDYVAAAKAAYLGFKDARPDRPALMGALCKPSRSAYDRTLFANDLGLYTDAMNFHVYAARAEYPAVFGELKQFLSDQGLGDLAIWVTESGTHEEGLCEKDGAMSGQRAHSPEQELQQAAIAAESQMLLMMSGVSRDYFFCFPPYNEMGGKKDWGMMRRDGSLKPVAAVFAEMIRRLGKAELLGEVASPDGGRAYAFRQLDGSSTVCTVGKGLPTYRDGVADVKVLKPAAKRGVLGARPRAADEDRRLVLQLKTNEDDFRLGGGKSSVELTGETGRVTVVVYNFDAKDKTGVIESEGARIDGLPANITVPARGKVEIAGVYRPSETESLDRLVLRGRFAGRTSSRLVANVTNPAMLRKSCLEVPLDIGDEARWERNDSADESEASWDPAEGARRFHLSWKRNVDRWAYPRYRLTPGELDGALMLEFEIKSAQDKVENDFVTENVMLFPDGPARHIGFAAPLGTWERRTIDLSAEKGLSDVKALSIGLNPAGHDLTYWIRNVRLYKAKVRVVDFGAEGVGGYPVLTARQVNGPARIRLSYATHPKGLGPKGDFWHETRATYLGEDVDLPIRPASTDRFDVFDVPTNGTYRAPLQQGLVRYVRIEVESGAADVDVAFDNRGTHSTEQVVGSFECSDPELTKIWRASVRTCQLAAIPGRGTETLPYLSDGAKRDRLVWSGDLWWAQRNMYAAFGPSSPYLPGSIDMLAENQTPAGYVNACPYPESRGPVTTELYGPFGSDEFAAWFVPVLADHYFYTGDKELLRRRYPNAVRVMDYLARYQDANGLFSQRPETAKHSEGLAVGGTSLHHRTYMHLLLWRANADAARLATWLGRTADARRFKVAADRLAVLLRKRFFRPALGRFGLSLEQPDAPAFTANAAALAFGFLSGDEAKGVLAQLSRHEHGKFQMMAMRGAFELRDGAKAAAHARDDAKAVFGDPSLRYWNLVNGEEDW